MEIFGLIITIVFGIPTLLSYRNRKKTTLYFVKDKQINLKEDLLKNFENLTIKYNNIEVNEKITFVKGYLLCSGTRDILERENSIEIFANESVWLNFKITNSSRGLHSESRIKDNQVIVDFGLLKSKEWIEFEGLISDNSVIRKEGKGIKLDFFHRIPNLPKIKEINKMSYKDEIGTLIISLLFAFTCAYTIKCISDISSLDLTAFDANKKTEIINTELLYSDSYKKAIYKFDKDYIGFESFFSDSKKYRVDYNDKSLKKKMVSQDIYFRRENYFDLGFAILLLFIFIGCLFLIWDFITSVKKSNLAKLLPQY